MKNLSEFLEMIVGAFLLGIFAISMIVMRRSPTLPQMAANPDANQPQLSSPVLGGLPSAQAKDRAPAAR